MIILILLVIGCVRNKTVEVPSEIYGKWIDEKGEMELHISQDSFKQIDVNPGDDNDTLLLKIDKIKQQNCPECKQAEISASTIDDSRKNSIEFFNFQPKTRQIILYTQSSDDNRFTTVLKRSGN